MGLPLLAKCYIAASAVGAAATLGWLAQREFFFRPLPAFAILALLAIVVGSRLLTVTYKGQAFQFSLESSLILALMTIYGVLPAVVVQGVSTVVTDALNRKPWPKILFNASQLMLSVAAAGAVLELALGHEIQPPGMSMKAEQLPTLLLGFGTWLLVNTLSTAVIVKLASGQSTWEVIRDFFLSRGSAIEATALLAVPPIAVTARYNPFLTLFLVVPLAVTFHATKVALENLSLLETQEVALRATRAEEEAARQREAAHAAAEQANRAKSEFLSQMSHELRTPLNAILGFAHLLEMDELTPDQKESTGYIIKGGEHLLGLINEVLDISRIEAGRMELSLEPVDAFVVVQECVSLVTPLAESEAIELVLEEPEAEGSPREVIADRKRLSQVMLNLISNGIKYNRPGGCVRISFVARAEDSCLRIDVADTGPGIPPERIRKLFAPFERLGAEGSNIEGTGLGLALSKPLVEAMEGTMSVTSEPGKGTIFSVELRLAGTSTAATTP